MQSVRYCANKKFIILGIMILVSTIQFLFGYNYSISIISYRDKMNLIKSKKDEISEMSNSVENLNGPTSDINITSNTNMAYPRIQKIFLVSSNPRTGSSYAANIITAMPNSAYYYEPFRITSHLSNNRQVDFKEFLVRGIKINEHVSYILIKHLKMIHFILRKLYTLFISELQIHFAVA